MGLIGNFLGRISLRQRLMFIAFVFSAPLALLLWLLVSEKQIAIDFATKEMDGTAYLRPVVKGLELARRHEADVVNNLAAAEDNDLNRAEAALEELKGAERELGGSLGTGDQFRRMAAVWADTMQKHPGESAADTIERHGELASAIRAVIAKAGDSSNLILDPDLDTYYVMTAVVVHLPQVMDLTYRIVDLPPEKGVDRSVLAGILKNTLHDLELAYAVALKENPAGNLTPALSKPIRSFTEAMNGLVEKPDVANGIDAATQSMLLWSLSAKELDVLLQNRVDGFQHRKNQAFVISGVTVITAYMLVFLILSSITVPLMQLSTKISAFTKTLDLGTRIETSDKAEIGGVADCLNDHIKGLSEVVAGVSKLAGRVSHSSSNIADSVAEQAKIEAEQASSVTNVRNSMESISNASTDIARTAVEVSATSREALAMAERGVRSLEAFKSKMEDIRAENRRAHGEIALLGEKAQEINKTLDIISAINDQTHMIAFNAALESAAAGEMGKRFSIVASEIRRLASNVTVASTEIAHTISMIQDAMLRLVVTSEAGSRILDDGLRVTANIATELEEIVVGAKVSTQSSGMIMASTRRQKESLEAVLGAFREIDSGINHSSATIIQTSNTTEDVKGMASELARLVSRFRNAHDAA